MNKKMIANLIEKTQECLARYWQHDYQYVLSLCSENVVWVGAAAGQFMQGLPVVEEDFKSTDRELKRCHLSNQIFYVAGNDTKSCTICGKYLVTTDPDESIFLQVEQRCTFQWKMEKDKIRIDCIHVSNPMGEMHLNAGEKFPNWLGKQSFKYLNRTISQAKEQKRFALTDKEGTTHFMNENEIIYVKADDHGIILHTMEDVKRYAISFSDFLQTHGSSLVEVRRSYAVNFMHVKSMKGRELQMQNEDIILLPEKKVAQVRKRLKEQAEK